MKVVDSFWYSTMKDYIGIVVVDTGYGHKAYIGAVRGLDKHADEQDIAMNGAKFYHGPELFPYIVGWAS